MGQRAREIREQALVARTPSVKWANGRHRRVDSSLSGKCIILKILVVRSAAARTPRCYFSLGHFLISSKYLGVSAVYIKDFPCPLGAPCYPHRIAHGTNYASSLRVLSGITFTLPARSLRQAQFLRPSVHL